MLSQQVLTFSLFTWFDPQAAEEEAEELAASQDDQKELQDESMDEAEESLPSLGKRRSTDTALSGQTPTKRSRPGSLAEVSLHCCPRTSYQIPSTAVAELCC